MFKLKSVNFDTGIIELGTDVKDLTNPKRLLLLAHVIHTINQAITPTNTLEQPEPAIKKPTAPALAETQNTNAGVLPRMDDDDDDAPLRDLRDPGAFEKEKPPTAATEVSVSPGVESKEQIPKLQPPSQKITLQDHINDVPILSTATKGKLMIAHINTVQELVDMRAKNLLQDVPGVGSKSIAMIEALMDCIDYDAAPKVSDHITLREIQDLMRKFIAIHTPRDQERIGKLKEILRLYDVTKIDELSPSRYDEVYMSIAHVVSCYEEEKNKDAQ